MKISNSLVASAVFVCLSIASPVPNPAGAVAPRASFCPISYGPGIVASTYGTPVFKLELNDSSGTATLTTTGQHGPHNFAGGVVEYFEGPGCYWAYLNIGGSSHPWKPLSWSTTSTTTNWNAVLGQNLTALATPAYPQTSDFLACKKIATATTAAGLWKLFLLTQKYIPVATDDTLVDIDVKSCVITKLLVEPTPGYTFP